MSSPSAPTHRERDTSSAPRNGMELSDWIFTTWVLAGAALVLWIGNQVTHFFLIRQGTHYACATQGLPDSARALGAADQGRIWGESTFFPPTFFCSYPRQDRVQVPVVVDMYPAGPWIFWISLVVLALTAVLGVVLRRRARTRGTDGNATRNDVPPSSGAGTPAAEF